MVDFFLEHAMNRFEAFLFLCIAAIFSTFSFAGIQETNSIKTLTVGSGALQIAIEEASNGIAISSVKVNGTETLNTAVSPEIFALSLRNTSANLILGASEGWGLVTTTNDGVDCRIDLSQPAASGAPPELRAVLTLHVEDSRSQWDLVISGLGSWSLMDTNFPQLNIQASGSDHLLVPRFSGIVFPDPVSAGIDWHEIYPAGWHASMQFLAYYNSEYSLYFGFHDPGSSIKTFNASVVSGGISLGVSHPVPGRSTAANDWEAPGVFELDAFTGDWYDAALIYRKWASANADFWPEDSPERRSRMAGISGVSVWANFGGGYDPAVVESNTLDFADYMGVPVGLTWYQWNHLYDDDNYPEYFPERTGMTGAVTNMQNTGIKVVPYINGRLFDTDLEGDGPEGIDFTLDGEPYAAKDEAGNYYSQVFTGNLFAYMCPTQAHWQDFLISAADRLEASIGCEGLYIDQIGAASPMQCMDAGHGHPVGGGNSWITGYDQMIGRINTMIPDGRFLTTESGADAYLNEFEGFMVQGWQADGMVPAFQAAFSDVVRLFGSKTGVSQYDEQQFYCKLGLAFSHGIQLGRFYTSIRNATGNDEKAPLFIRRIGRIHHKLREFFGGGLMKRPPELTGIGTITTVWTYTYDGDLTVTIPQVPSSSWFLDEAGRQSVVLVFVNASMTDSANLSFDFDGADFGLSGNLFLQQIDDTSDSPVTATPAVFTQTLDLSPLEATAILISTIDAPLGSFIFRNGFESGDPFEWSEVHTDDLQSY